MAVILHAVSLAGVCRKGRSSPVPQVRARPEKMRCVGSKRTRELGRDMLLAASIVESSVAKAHGTWEKSHCVVCFLFRLFPRPMAGTRGCLKVVYLD